MNRFHFTNRPPATNSNSPNRSADAPQRDRSTAIRSALRDESGYSLTELMIVLVVIGILALLALPKFMNVTTKAKMTEAKTQLKHLHTLQTAHYYERDVYAERLAALGFEQSTLITDGGNARYRIAIDESGRSGYRATATSVVDYDNDGTFNVWAVDESGAIQQVTPD
jgi:type IV pilus assembly protein PilE